MHGMWLQEGENEGLRGPQHTVLPRHSGRCHTSGWRATWPESPKQSPNGGQGGPHDSGRREADLRQKEEQRNASGRCWLAWICINE
jgi:hypothetical protein